MSDIYDRKRIDKTKNKSSSL